jgi:hypothetical protein
MGQEVILVVWIVQSLTNPVKAVAKDTLGWPLMLFDPNWFDDMAPRPNVIGPAKRQRQSGK